MLSSVRNCLKAAHLKSFRNFSLSSSVNGARTYDGEGKTSVHILNNDNELGLMINGVSQVGFRLNNNMTVLGPMAIFARSVLSWNINSVDDITEESLSLFTTLEPKLDIIVIGIGDKPDNLNFYKRLVPILRKHRLSVEILPTEQACSTFNFLNSESRHVAGAMIPPYTLRTTDDDTLLSKLRYQNLYEMNDIKFL
ncbi:PREDICTED: NADH dehydrogenase [ubiquinone] 1 alpha subcomplex assembly factor 3 [Nicrophorus vespilloides]|uniref:NADH dehydrogenase [ubiquinone] 1 alpha subcomplex assembly factor 3 n=1 Tax=Nicrophorus vespilloides TaxID=110193 RepID=A0ABM1MKN0_NICVS|nr:PREDICTED: NADH dehydrogenase [ubiquinone] 1 alpha subcomplex assembly factor 3 [Nicrophorus vespilloides]